MPENKKWDIQVNGLGEKLKWYMLYASDEEYDEKAVESIMYLLDKWEPLEEGAVPPVEESWKRFLAVADRKELLPTEDAAVKAGAEGPNAGQTQKPVPEEDGAEHCMAVQKLKSGAGRPDPEGRRETCSLSGKGQKTEADMPTGRESDHILWSIREEKGETDMSSEKEPKNVLQPRQKEESAEKLSLREDTIRVENITENTTRRRTENGIENISINAKQSTTGNMLQVLPEEENNSGVAENGKHGKRGKARKLAKFADRHKVVAAAVLLLMVLMVGNTIHAVANPETGFFFWLKRDESGVKMITSPEELDGTTNKKENIFYDRDDAPEWAQDWIEIETEVEIETEDTYELQYFEISGSDNRKHITSYFLSEDLKRDIVVGVWVYWDKVSYFKEEFVDYDYVQSYEFAHKEMDIYKKTEDTGQVYYTVCFYDGNCKYYVKGWENLDEVKRTAEDYWRCVQKNM